MKKWLCALILCGVLLNSGCMTDLEGSADGTETETTASQTDDAARADAEARALYYEQLANDLQAELLQTQAALYIARTAAEQSVPAAEEAQPAFSYTVENGGATVTSYLGEESNVTVPASLGGVPVVAVADRAFADNLRLQSVVLPEGVVSVGWFAFSGCVALGAVRLPASVASIAYGAFENCPASLVIHCFAGSYAEQYARSYGIRTAN